MTTQFLAEHTWTLWRNSSSSYDALSGFSRILTLFPLTDMPSTWDATANTPTLTTLLCPSLSYVREVTTTFSTRTTKQRVT